MHKCTSSLQAPPLKVSERVDAKDGGHAGVGEGGAAGHLDGDEYDDYIDNVDDDDDDVEDEKVFKSSST